MGAGEAITIRQARPGDLGAVAELMVECFPQEFGLLFGQRLQAACAAVEGILRLETGGRVHALVAEDSSSVIGMLLLESARRGRLNRSLATMWRIARDKVGLRHLPRALLGVALPSYHVKPAEAYIRAIGVTARARRRGVATRLLQEAGVWARANHMTRLALHVSSDNAGARSLYRRLGFIERREETNLLAHLLLGQRSTIYMSKALEDTP